MFDQLSLTVHSWVMAGTALAAAGSFLRGMVSVVSSPCHWVSLPIMVRYIAGQDRAFRVRYSVHYATAFVGGLLITIALVGMSCSLPDLGQKAGTPCPAGREGQHPACVEGSHESSATPS